MRALVVVALSACSIKPIDYTGKECPCPNGYRCEAVSQTCTTDDEVATDADVGGDAAPLIDAVQATNSCLPNARTKSLVSADSFAGFPSGWGIGNGTWSTSGGDVHQDSTDRLSFIYRSVAVSNYRVMATMYRLGALTDSLGIPFRIAGSGMYFCVFDPQEGGLELHRVMGTSDDVLGALTLAPLNPVTKKFTLEIQSIGSVHQCCVQGVPGLIEVTDTFISSGFSGLVTYNGEGAFSSYYAFD
jgi:hypothetical protein